MAYSWECACGEITFKFEPKGVDDPFIHADLNDIDHFYWFFVDDMSLIDRIFGHRKDFC